MTTRAAEMGTAGGGRRTGAPGTPPCRPVKGAVLLDVEAGGGLAARAATAGAAAAGPRES
eukprot:9522093-Alexandrium_andersonii.AAC.1